MSANRLLVPVSQSATVRQTVEYAVETALESGDDATIRFVYVHPTDLTEDPDTADRKTAEQLLGRAEVWATEDAGTDEELLSTETAHLGTDRYLFSPEEVATIIAADARDHDIDRVVLDPEYDPGIGAPFVRPLEYELSRFTWLQTDEAPVEPRTQRAPLLEQTSALQVGALFGIAFIFYQVLGGTLSAFDIVTGVISATIVAVGLSRVTFTRDPSRNSLARGARMIVYIPYLLVEIIRANIIIAAVILHPRLPIEPRLTRVRPALWGSLSITTLANSITLTPGTLTVRVDGRALTVHTLVPAAREDLFDGGLERAVRFVFYGRDAMKIGSIRDRGEFEILQPSPKSVTASETEADGSSDGDESADGDTAGRVESADGDAVERDERPESGNGEER